MHPLSRTLYWYRRTKTVDVHALFRNGVAMMENFPLQFSLDVTFPDESTFDYFWPTGNHKIFDLLLGQTPEENEPYIYIWGDKGSGAEHLLQASCYLAQSQGLRAVYLPLENLKAFSTNVLNDLENLDLICLSKIDQIIGDLSWEKAIFHLFNRCHDMNKRMLISASVAPQSHQCALPDLSSRLAWGLAYRMNPLSDEMKMDILQFRLNKRGMMVNLECLKYILTHYSRSMNDLIALVDTLDRTSLQTQRRITIPFVKSLMNM